MVYIAVTCWVLLGFAGWLLLHIDWQLFIARLYSRPIILCPSPASILLLILSCVLAPIAFTMALFITLFDGELLKYTWWHKSMCSLNSWFHKPVCK